MRQPEPRYEVLPFGRSEEQAAALPAPVRLTVTTSPKHGVDLSVDQAVKLRALGHRVTVHLAARMVRGREHLERILARTDEAGIDDLFVVGGDAPAPLGPYDSAGALLDVLAGHPLRPAALGIAGYPEGHPLIAHGVLEAELERKAPLADYLVSQLCFEPSALVSWLEELRARGIALPLYAGVPGRVERRRLLEISVRIGVGPSLRLVRKQRGLANLLRSPVDAAGRLVDELAPLVGEPRLGIVGFHFFTLGELLATWRWQRDSRRDTATAGGSS